MNIKVRIKQIGSRRDRIGEVAFPIENKPLTVAMLITECVITFVGLYNGRINKSNIKPFSEAELKAMSEVGKIAFGELWGEKEADPDEAVSNALKAYEDGLFRIFIDEAEAGALNDSIEISDDSIVTFIKLTMLAGRLW